MNRRAICSLMLSLVCLPFEAAADEDAQQIRQRIPAAAAMRKADMDKLATSPTPNFDDIKDKSLTLQLFSMKLKDRTDEQLEEYKILAERLKPAELVAEIYRARRIGGIVIPLAPVTAIHAERITDFTCEVDGDTARGIVTYKVPDLYQGRVNYVAQRKGDKWRITEFLMPAHKLHIVRSDDGRWSEQK